MALHFISLIFHKITRLYNFLFNTQKICYEKTHFFSSTGDFNFTFCNVIAAKNLAKCGKSFMYPETKIDVFSAMEDPLTKQQIEWNLRQV